MRGKWKMQLKTKDFSPPKWHINMWLTYRA